MINIMCIRIKPVYVVICILSCCLCVFASADKEPTGIKSPVLMYHQLTEDYSRVGQYVISVNEFEGHIKKALEKGFTPVFASELLNYCEDGGALPEKPIVFTFDDGYLSDYQYVFPLLKKYNIKANFAIVGAVADFYSTGCDRHISYAHTTWDEIREMQRSGLCEFFSHSYNMHDLKKRKGILQASNETHDSYVLELEDDIEKNRQAFVKNLGHEPAGFVYPFGCVSKEAEKIINSHFKITLGTYEKVNNITGSGGCIYKLKRFNMVHNRNLDKILKYSDSNSH